jgi:hypothetical protein
MMERNNLKHLSTGNPTYLPSDRNKLPDLVDFCVTKGIPQDFAVAKSCFDLSSNHSLVLITLKAHVLNQEKQPSLSNRHTKYDNFRHFITERLTSLQTEKDIEVAAKLLNDTIQWAGWNATPEHTDTLNTYDFPLLIKKINTSTQLREILYTDYNLPLNRSTTTAVQLAVPAPEIMDTPPISLFGFQISVRRKNI